MLDSHGALVNSSLPVREQSQYGQVQVGLMYDGFLKISSV
jgi:hypothetical protein